MTSGRRSRLRAGLGTLCALTAAAALALAGPLASASADPGDETPTPTSTLSPVTPPESTTPTADASPTEAPDPSATPTDTDEGNEGDEATTEPAAPTTTPEAEDQPKVDQPPSDAPRAQDAPQDAPADPQAVVPPATGNNAVVTVKVAGDRTGTAEVAPLQGVTLGFYDNATGGTARFTCTSDADGDCSIVVPSTQPGQGGTNRDDRFWVRQTGVPAGWTQNAALRTGDAGGGGSQSTAYRFRTGTQLRAGQTYRSTDDFMVGTGNTNREASGGIWQQSRTNPILEQQCGIDVSLVLDISGSVGNALPDLKDAADQFADSLVGTPSRMSLYSFSTVSPGVGADRNYPALTSVSTQAQADDFKARYSTWTSNGGTNWDRGLFAAASGGLADVVIVITDGNPSYYNDPEQGPGNYTRFREMENGIFSANAIKALGSRVVAVGVGSGVDDAATGLNLQAISGPTRGSDYFQSANYDQAAAVLRAFALGNCRGSVSVVKEIVPSTNTGEDVTGSQPAGAGWTFAGSTSTSGIGGLPATQTTTADGTGAVNFPLVFPGGTTTAQTTFTETQQTGYTLVTQGGNNAVCRRLDTGAAVPVTNSGALGFQVTAASVYPVSCTVYNRVPQPAANIVVGKQWVINGTTYAEGSQPDGFEAELSLTGPDGAAATPQGWGVQRTGYSVGDTATISETTTLDSDLCELTSSRVTEVNLQTADEALPYEATLTLPSNAYEVTNTVTCQSLLTLAKVVQPLGSTDPTQWTLEAVAPGGALPGPVGATGTPGVTSIPVTPGVTYQLRETGGDPRFAQDDRRTNQQSNPLSTGSMICRQVTAGGVPIPGFSDGLNGGVIVPLGARIECVAVNQAAELVLQKVVENEYGGTAVPSDWELTATPTGDFPAGLEPITVPGAEVGEPQLVRPDVAYRLTESGPDGYEQVSLTCEVEDNEPRLDGFISLAPNTTGTCTFTNRDTPAALTLVKTVTNDNGGTAVDTDWTLSADGPTAITGTTGSDAVTAAVVDAGSYDLSEAGGPEGYTASDWQCTGGSLTGATVVVPSGGDVTCTIVNDDQPAQLTLVKTVVNDDGGTAAETDWTLAADGPTPGVSGASGSPEVTAVSVDAGAYDLSESGGPDGYTASDWVCTGGTLSGAEVTVPGGGDVTCTITNDDQPAQLTLVKTVVNDNGGTAADTDWTLSAAGPTPISGATGDAAVTDAPVSAGGYDLSEAGGPAGYTPSAWQCSGGTLTDSTIVIPNGGDVTCTITNDDQPALLTLVKVVDGEQAGTGRVPADWTLTATPVDITGQDPVAGNGDPSSAGGVNEVEVFSGDYTLAEDGPTGFDSGDWVCQGGVVDGDEVTVPPGGNVVCTITNTAITPLLTLVKQVVNDDGGTAAATDWTLTASGPTPVSGAVGDPAVTAAPVMVGAYDLAETGPTGYTASDWTCEGGSQDGSTVTLAEGDDVTCTIVNDDQPAQLTLVKTVVNDNGGTAADTDWTLSADGPTAITGTTGSETVTAATVSAGSYDLSEAGGPEGYTASDWVCTGGTLTGATVVVANGGAVTCTITNDDEPATLTLVKTVVNDNGGTAASTDWTLSADGPTPITGATGEAAVTAAIVDAGAYALSEADGPEGYAAGDWVCEGGDLDGATVSVPNGGDVTCTIVNDDQPAQLTLVKTVVNDNGGTAADTDWTLGADGPTPITGTTGSAAVTNAVVEAGGYDLSETGGPDGYTASEWVCTGGTATDATVVVPTGGDVTCTITNDDQPAQLTLVKQVVNEVGGSAVDTDWTLSADGPTPITGTTGGANVTDATVDAGSYDLSEADGPPGYEAGDWTCEGGSLEGASVTLQNGTSTTCTIVNTDVPNEPTVTKTVNSATDNGAGEWTIVYDVVVSNEDDLGNGAATLYDLEDTLAFGEGVTVEDASIEGPEDVAVNDAWDGVEDTLVAEGVELEAGASDTYTVTVDASVATTLTVQSGDCVVDEGEEGTGFLNVAVATGPTTESVDQDCAPAVPPVTPTPSPTPTTPPSPPLAFTGADLPALVLLAVVLLGLGALAVVAARRGREDAQH